MTDLIYLKKQVSIIINLYNSKRYGELIKKGMVLIKKFPNQIIFYNATALSFAALGKNKDAKSVLKDALIQSPNDINVLNNLGLIHFNIREYNHAREYYEKALLINNRFVDALVNLSNLDLEEHKIASAKKNLDLASQYSSSPEKSEIINVGLGHFYQRSGNFEKALHHFNQVKKLNPSNSIVDREISLMKSYSEKDDPHIEEMKNKIKETKDIQLIKRLSFALGKAYEDTKNYKKAFQFLKKANKIAAEETNYQIEDDIKLFSKIELLFNQFRVNKFENCKKKIIFIVGMPRSGTTLTEQIISSHKNVFGAGELNFLTESIEKHILDKVEEFNNENFLNALQKIRDEYVLSIKKFNYTQEYITDKAPLNFRWVGLIKLIFPNSKIVHCKRDPMDICFSNFKNSFAGTSLSFSYDLENLGKFYNLYKKLMLFWKNNLAESFYDLQYENLIENQKVETKKLLDFCELDWDEKCLEPHKNKNLVATASIVQVRSPVYNTSIKKWHNYYEQLTDLKKLIENY
jgi:tetratricopeptide (TPR) repeat protein